MKRYWRVLTLVIVFGVISTYGLAAGNGILLPAGHWAYDAMSELARDGLLDKYPYVQKSGGDLLTRYEMANYLKQMIVRLEKTKTETQLNDRQIKLINKLLEEFKNELLTLGINLTDLGKMSPSVTNDHPTDNTDGYLDLDYVLSNDTSNTPGQIQLDLPRDLSEPYYLMGEYIAPDLTQNIFFFSPENFIDPQTLVELKVNNRWDIIYSTGEDFRISFIIVKGIFPVGAEKVEGYYFFPLENGKKPLDSSAEKNVYSLLDSLSQNYEVNNLWQFKGHLPFAKILSEEKYEKWHMTNGLQIGEFLVSTKKDNPLNPSLTTTTTFRFTDVDDWLKNPFSLENKPLDSAIDPLAGNEFPSSGTNGLSDWQNLFSTPAPWTGSQTSGAAGEDPLPGLDNYTWNPVLNNRWSSLLFSFQLLTDKTVASDQPFVF